MSRYLLIGGALLGGTFKAYNHTAETVASAATVDQRKVRQFYRPNIKGPINELYAPFRLGEIMNIAEDVAIFRFLFDDPEAEFILPPCSTLQACFKDGLGNRLETCERHYTPITPNGRKGYFDLIVKKQKRGRMTEHMFSMKVGESLSFRCIQFKMQYKANKWKNVGMIAGGTGITPMLQVMRAALDNAEDKTKLSLLYANRDESKILLEGLIDHYADNHPDRFKVKYVIDKEPADGKEWNGYIGHINKEMVKATMPEPSDDNLLLLCGPDAMMVNVGGTTVGQLFAMSAANPSQGAHSGLNNLNDIPPHCVIGSLGWGKNQVYRF